MTRSGYAEVPLTPPDGFRLLCESQLNKQPVTMLVATGTSFNLLDDDTADRLKLPYKSTGLEIVFGGEAGESELHVARIGSWSFGAATTKNIAIGVADLTKWFNSREKGPKGVKIDMP
jgi:predicted aspartyl protease